MRVDSFTHQGLQFEVLDGGPPDGEVVLLLHGFPQDATTWDEVTPYLHRAGLRTLAPHQRGYSANARPRPASAYRLDNLVGDVLALLDAAGVQRAHVVGHDWGGGVAWALAQSRPDRVASLVVLSTPHPEALLWAARHRDQARRSWYMLAFQLPLLPEVILAEMLRRGSLVRTGLPAERNRRYAARLARPRDLRGPLNWYRAFLRPRSRRGEVRKHGDTDGYAVTFRGEVTVPTTFIWGSRDPFLGRAAAGRTVRHVRAPYRFVELPAGHWLPEREPRTVAREVVDRVERPGTPGRAHGTSGYLSP